VRLSEAFKGRKRFLMGMRGQGSIEILLVAVALLAFVGVVSVVVSGILTPKTVTGDVAADISECAAAGVELQQYSKAYVGTSATQPGVVRFRSHDFSPGAAASLPACGSGCTQTNACGLGAKPGGGKYFLKRQDMTTPALTVKFYLETSTAGSFIPYSTSGAFLDPPPFVQTPPADVIAVTGQSPAPAVQWTLQDTVGGGSFTVRKIVGLVETVTQGPTAWTPGTTVTQSVDVSTVSDYKYRVEFTDSKGQSASDEVAVSVQTPVLTTISVTPSSAAVNTNQQQSFAATCLNQAGLAMACTVSWSTTGGSLNPLSGTTSPPGTPSTSTTFTAPATTGSITITASSGGKSGTAGVTVTQAPVETVTVSPATASILKGSTQQFTASCKDAGGSTTSCGTITWSSSNTGVATVTSSGLATGVNGGTATITATAGGKTGSASLTVTLPPAPTVVSTFPLNGATFVCNQASWGKEITFSLAMDQSATNPAVTISPSGILNKAWDGTSKTVTLTHGLALAMNTQYTITVSTAARSQAGVNMASPYTFSFTTCTTTTNCNSACVQ
jgi:hypothetical protein